MSTCSTTFESNSALVFGGAFIVLDPGLLVRSPPRKRGPRLFLEASAPTIKRLGPRFRGEERDLVCPYRRRRLLPRARDNLTTSAVSALGVASVRGARPNIDNIGGSSTSQVSTSPNPLKRLAIATP